MKNKAGKSASQHQKAWWHQKQQLMIKHTFIVLGHFLRKNYVVDFLILIWSMDSTKTHNKAKIPLKNAAVNVYIKCQLTPDFNSRFPFHQIIYFSTNFEARDLLLLCNEPLFVDLSFSQLMVALYRHRHHHIHHHHRQHHHHHSSWFLLTCLADNCRRLYF